MFIFESFFLKLHTGKHKKLSLLAFGGFFFSVVTIDWMKTHGVNVNNNHVEFQSSLFQFIFKKVHFFFCGKIGWKRFFFWGVGFQLKHTRVLIAK